MRTVPNVAPNISQSYNTSSRSVYVEWEPLPQDVINGKLKGYMIQYTATDGQIGYIRVCNNILNVTIRDMITHETYDLRIAAFTSKGTGPLSKPVYVTTDEDGE